MEKEDSNRKPKRRSKLPISSDNLLILLMVIAVAIGVGLGIGLRSIWEPTYKRKLHYLRFPGDLLLNMLKMMIIPLIVSSMVSSLAFLDAKASGKMGVRAIVYYLTTTLCAVIVGIILVVSIKPGDRKDRIEKAGSAKNTDALDALFDLIRNCFPDNLIEACFQKQTTVVNDYKITRNVYKMVNVTGNMTTQTPNQQMVQVLNHTYIETVDDPKVQKASGMNILGLVVFSIFFGCTLSKMGPAGKPLADFFECMHIATMKLVTLIIWYSPFGIIFLIAVKLVEMENIEDVFSALGFYMLTVLLGLAIHCFLILPLVFFVGTGFKNPFKFMYNMLRALLTAWGTASSSATLPVTMECLEDLNKVDARVVKFVTPIGATINMDGTALYEAVASIFIAQHIGVSLNFGQVIIVSLTSTAAAIGAAGIPSAGLVTMAIVLTAVGLPVEEITLILSVDWFLDRFRTAVNVLGDAYGAGLVAHLSRDDLAEMDKQLVHGLDLNDIDIAVTPEKVPQKQSNGVDNHSFTATKM